MNRENNMLILTLPCAEVEQGNENANFWYVGVPIEGSFACFLHLKKIKIKKAYQYRKYFDRKIRKYLPTSLRIILEKKFTFKEKRA